MTRRSDYASMTERTCTGCKETKPIAEFYRMNDLSAPLGWRYASRCRACCSIANRRYAQDKGRRNARLRGWRAKNPDAARAKDRRARLQAKYGLTEAQVEEMKARDGGLCWVCGRRPAIHVEHNHDTGRVRGVTCSPCNTGVLASLDADPDYLQRVVDYLAEAGEECALPRPARD